MTSRDTLIANLERYQQAGIWATQADTLRKLTQVALNDAINTPDEDLFGMAQVLCMQAYAAYEQIGDRAGMAYMMDTMFEIDWQWFNWEGERIDLELSERLTLYRVTLEACIQIEDHRHQAELYWTIGWQSPVEEQIQAYKRALLCYERLGDVKEQARMHLSIGRAYGEETPEGQRYLERSLEMYKSIGDRYGQQLVRRWIKRSSPPSEHITGIRRIANFLRRLF